MTSCIVNIGQLVTLSGPARSRAGPELREDTMEATKENEKLFKAAFQAGYRNGRFGDMTPEQVEENAEANYLEYLKKCPSSLDSESRG